MCLCACVPVCLCMRKRGQAVVLCVSHPAPPPPLPCCRHGGTFLGALKDNTFRDWIQEHNGPPDSPGFEAAVDVFMRSCAGYCLATYVMGVGDRHNDNIMVKKTGHYFHIDFGHFLGNFKFQFGVRRERSAFVFTAEMLRVMGDRDSATFKQFMELCCRGLHTLRGCVGLRRRWAVDGWTGGRVDGWR